MKELEQGFQKAQKERELKGLDCPAPLNAFVIENEEKMKQLLEQSKLAMVRQFWCIIIVL